MKNKNNNVAERPTAVIAICAVLAVLIVALAVWFLFFHKSEDAEPEKFVGVLTDADGGTETVVLDYITENSPFLPVDTDPLETVVSDDTQSTDDESASTLEGTEISQGITLMEISSYSGPFVEDGNDMTVDGVLCAVIRNDGERDIQYAEIYISVNDVFACFKVTTLPVGNSVIVLEDTKMEYTEGAVISYAKVSNVAYFTEGMSLYSDIFTVTGRDGYINLSNNSDNDINGDVVVYYKTVSDGAYFGGITYSVRAAGGIGAKSSVLLSAPHFLIDSCKVMFITYEK